MACPVAALQRVAEVVEGRAAGDDGLLEGRQRLGDVDQHQLGLVVGRSGAEHARIGGSQPGVGRRALAQRAAASRPSSLSSRIGRMLCAHRLSAAPAQPNQRLRRRLASAMALRSTRASADAARRGRRRRRAPGRDRWRRSACRRRRGACRRTAAARARSPPRCRRRGCWGRGANGGGHGPCARIAARSASLKAGAGSLCRSGRRPARRHGDRQRGKAGDGGGGSHGFRVDLAGEARAPVALEQVERQPPACRACAASGL